MVAHNKIFCQRRIHSKCEHIDILHVHPISFCLFPHGYNPHNITLQGPLKEVKDLKELSSNPAAKEKFLAEISSLLLL